MFGRNDPAVQIPTGLGMALMKDPAALEWFNGLSNQAQQAIVERTHSIRSKEEMAAFVGRMGQGSTLR